MLRCSPRPRCRWLLVVDCWLLVVVVVVVVVVVAVVVAGVVAIVANLDRPLLSAHGSLSQIWYLFQIPKSPLKTKIHK